MSEESPAYGDGRREIAAAISSAKSEIDRQHDALAAVATRSEMDTANLALARRLLGEAAQAIARALVILRA